MENKKLSKKELLAIADKARENSYSPYSNISVGAALLTEDGKVYSGTNFENVAYSHTICAERAAFAAAISAGERHFSAIAVAGGKAGAAREALFPPCGACRQVMAEFCSGDFEVILSEDEVVKLSELLPLEFNFDGKDL